MHPRPSCHAGRVPRSRLEKSKEEKEEQVGHNGHFAACGAPCVSSERGRGHFPGWPREVLPAAKQHETTLIAWAKMVC